MSVCMCVCLLHHSFVFIWAPVKRWKPLHLVVNMTHHKWKKVTVNQAYRGNLPTFMTLKCHSTWVGQCSTISNAAVIKWAFLLHMALATKRPRRWEMLKLNREAPGRPVSFEPNVSSWADRITPEEWKNSPALDLHLSSHQIPFSLGGREREEAPGRRKEKGRDRRVIAWGGRRGRERQRGDGKWQYNMIWFVGQNGFSLPIFWERGDEDGEEDRGGWRRWVECEQWDCGVHLALGPWDGLTAAGGSIRLLTLLQFCYLFSLYPSFSLSLIAVFVRPVVSITAMYGPFMDFSGRAKLNNDKNNITIH